MTSCEEEMKGSLPDTKKGISTTTKRAEGSTEDLMGEESSPE